MKVKVTLKTRISGKEKGHGTGGTRNAIFKRLAECYPEYVKNNDKFEFSAYEGDSELGKVYESLRSLGIAVQDHKHRSGFEMWETRIREYDEDELAAFCYWVPVSYDYLCYTKSNFALTFEGEGKSRDFTPSRKKIGTVGGATYTIAIEALMLSRFDDSGLVGLEWQKISGDLGRELYLLRSNLRHCDILNDYITVDKEILLNSDWEQGSYCLPVGGTYGVAQLRIDKEILKSKGDVYLTKQSFSFDERFEPYPYLIVSTKFKEFLAKKRLPMNWLPVTVE